VTAHTATLPLDGVQEALEAAAESQAPTEDEEQSGGTGAEAEREEREQREAEEKEPTVLAQEPALVAQPEPERSEASTAQPVSTEPGEPRRRTRRARTQTEAPRRRGRPPGSGRRARTAQTQPVQPSAAQQPHNGTPDVVQDRPAPEVRRRGPRTTRPGAERHFRVRFWVETVLDASSVLDAIREVERRGATDVTAVIREG
jgi:hypothetical protein